MAFADETKLEVWLALRQDGFLGHGLPQDPYDASSPTLFADRMNSFLPGTKIHLGPGIFQSPAFDPAKAPPAIWQAKSGWSIEGAGMFVTTIKVVGATSQTQESSGVGNSGFILGFSISNLSIDCNMRGHLGTGVCIGAITVYGSKTKVRRVRAIDFGTEGPSAGVECFVIGVAGAHPLYPTPCDCVIQDCLLEKPYKNGLYNSSCLIFFAGEDVFPDGKLAYHRHCVMRNNLFNCEYQDNPVPIASIAVSGTVATATTKIPHARIVNQWVIISGALENSQPSIHFNGSFVITNVSSATSFDFTFFPAIGASNPPTPAAVAPTGDMWVGKYSSDIQGIKNSVPASPNPDPDPYNPGVQGVAVDTTTNPGKWTVTLATDRPHWRVPGDNVWVREVRVNANVYSTILNHLYRVSDVGNPSKLLFILDSDPGTPFPIQPADAQINPTQVTLSADVGVGAIVEKNRVYNSRGGAYHDAWSTKDLIIRKNHFVAIAAGIYQNFVGATPRTGSSLIHTGTIAIFNTQTSHLLNTGDTVRIDGAVVNGSYSNPYNGSSFTITKLGETTFQYTMASDPGTNASGSPVFSKSTAPLAATSLVRDISDPDHPKAVFTTASPHGFQVNDFVSVFGATLSGSISNPFNGAFKVLTVTTNSFTYAITSDPGANASGTPQCARATACPLICNYDLAVFTTPAPHGLEAGQGILVSGATDPNITDTAFFDGGFDIESVPSPNSFTYRMKGSPAGYAAPSATIKSVWQVGSQILDRNIADIIFTSLKSLWGFASGITLGGGNTIPPYTFIKAIVRRNLVRTLDDGKDPDPNPYAIDVNGCAQAIVERNICNVSRANPIFHNFTGSIKYFDNAKPSGVLVQGTLNAATSQQINEITTDVELGLDAAS